MTTIDFQGAAITQIGSTSDTNVAIGTGAAIPVSQYSVCVGTNAVTYGNRSVAIGYNAYSSSFANIVFGVNASAQGGNATAIGNSSLSAPPNGQCHVIGAYASGSNDFCIALGSGNSPGTGAQVAKVSVAIGSGARANHESCVAIGTGMTTTTSNQTYIGNIFGGAGGGSNVLVTAAGIMNTNTSSITTKHNIRPLEHIDILQDQFKPLRFTFNTTNEESIGLIAENLFEVLPELCPLDLNNEPYNIRYDLLSVILLQEVRALYTKLKNSSK